MGILPTPLSEEILASNGSARRNKSTANCAERRLLERRRVDWEKVIVIPQPKADPAAPLGSERTPSPSLVTVTEPFFKETAESERKCQLRLVTLFFGQSAFLFAISVSSHRDRLIVR